MADVDIAGLSAAQRLLLFHDGTLTAALEALRLAPVVVEVVAQAAARLDSARAGWLGVPAGAQATHRLAGIRDQRTCALLVEMESHLLPGRLPGDFAATIAACAHGLGEALARLKLDCRRELLWYGRTPPSAGGRLARCYRLVAAGQPVGCVEERFLLAGPEAGSS